MVTKKETIKKPEKRTEKPKDSKPVKKTTHPKAGNPLSPSASVATTAKGAKATADKEVKVKTANYIRAVGRRKTAVARVRLFKDGQGKITVNSKDWKVYFPTIEQQYNVFQPLKLTGQSNNLDFTIKVVGGGLNSQSGAVRHGIARCLLKFNEEFKPSLKKAGCLTRDSRAKERKKPGLKRARRAPQWKKR